MARTNAKSAKPKFSATVLEIFSKLKDRSVKLPMLQQAVLLDKLANEHRIKINVIQKKVNRSLPYVYSLLNLASMTPKMKMYITSGKIKGTDALELIRKSKDEKEFIKLAEKLIQQKKESKIQNHQTVETSAKRGPGRPKKITVESSDSPEQPKRGRGRPRKDPSATPVEKVKRGPGRPRKEKQPEPATAKRGPGRPRKEEVVAIPDNVAARKEKIKTLIMGFLGKKVTPKKNKQLDSLVEELIAN